MSKVGSVKKASLLGMPTEVRNFDTWIFDL